MSEQYWKLGGIRFWNEDEIERRESFTNEIKGALLRSLQSINAAWTFHRVEGPILTPSDKVFQGYLESDDVWTTQKMGNKLGVLRPETTASSYESARRLNIKGVKFPLCVWQSGKSFRREKSDGATAAKMRFWEFNQLEFQCIYKKSTLADYKSHIMPELKRTISRHIGCEVREVYSDRLPEYSTETLDIEALVDGRWTEMASVSTRVDFSDNHLVLEVAIGLDRVVESYSRIKNA